MTSSPTSQNPFSHLHSSRICLQDIHTVKLLDQDYFHNETIHFHYR